MMKTRSRSKNTSIGDLFQHAKDTQKLQLPQKKRSVVVEEHHFEVQATKDVVKLKKKTTTTVVTHGPEIEFRRSLKKSTTVEDRQDEASSPTKVCCWGRCDFF